MLDVGWTELLVIAVVLIVVVGPKDLPPMLRAFGKTMARFRAIAGEFQNQFNDALKEADLDDVRKTLSDAKKFHPGNAIREAIAPLRDTAVDLRSDLQKATTTPAPAAVTPVAPLADTGSADGAAVLPSGDPVAPVVPAAETAVAAAPVAAAPVAPAPVAPAPSILPPSVPVPVEGTPVAASDAPVAKPRAPRRKKSEDAPISGATEAALATQAAIAAKPKRVRTAKKDEA